MMRAVSLSVWNAAESSVATEKVQRGSQQSDTVGVAAVAPSRRFRETSSLHITNRSIDSSGYRQLRTFLNGAAGGFFDAS